MGEGKTSVIIPMIAASLADTRQLVRIVVLKPLWRQMFHLLVNRLAGLVDRPVCYFPFARHIEVDAPKAQKLEELYGECMREGGILLALPEHILSFKLTCIDRLISGSSQIGQRLHILQEWKTRHTRDILDESDEILHVRYQLIYPVGKQRPLEDHPYRWTTTQQLLQIVARHILQLERTYPESFKYEPMQKGRFPNIRIMSHCKAEAVAELVRGVANDVLDGHIPNLHSIRVLGSFRNTALQLLISKELPYEGYESLKTQFNSTEWRGLLLVRGLLALGVLVFALKEKNYRVDYGLDLTRSQLAIPFSAKVIPCITQIFLRADGFYRIFQAGKPILDIQTLQ